MKKQPIYQVDAFTLELFGGNPAAVCPLSHWLSDETMQLIALENNLSETAFIVKEGEHYHIRWFTPNQEVALCGHATLASAFIIFEKLGHPSNTITFTSKSGDLRVEKKAKSFQMDFPALPFNAITPSPKLLNTLNVKPQAIYESTFDLLVILGSERQVAEAMLDLHAIKQLPYRGVILTSLTDNGSLYSRCFYPSCDVPEDPVTGSAHCVIAPYWSQRIGKQAFQASQGLKRKGALVCETVADRVLLSGQCQLYLEGQLYLP